MKYIDIHAHLDFEIFKSNKNKLVRDLIESNILVYSNTLNLNNYLETKKFYNDVKNIKVIPGLYPTDAEKIESKDLNKFLNFLKKGDYDLIGEVGLDKNEGRNIEKQIEILKKIIEIAIEKDKGVILHTRKAEKEVLEILSYYVKEKRFKKFCLHCFTGKKRYYETIKNLKIYCSIPLSVLKSHQFQELTKFLPINQILVETDSPFLNPFGESNSPVNIPLIYNKIAELKGYDKNEIKNIIFRNYLNFIN